MHQISKLCKSGPNLGKSQYFTRMKKDSTVVLAMRFQFSHRNTGWKNMPTYSPIQCCSWSFPRNCSEACLKPRVMFQKCESISLFAVSRHPCGEITTIYLCAKPLTIFPTAFNTFNTLPWESYSSILCWALLSCIFLCISFKRFRTSALRVSQIGILGCSPYEGVAHSFSLKRLVTSMGKKQRF